MTLDNRGKVLASICVNHSISARKGDIVLVQSDIYFKPFVEEIKNNVEMCGADVRVIYENLAEKRALLERNNPEELYAEAGRLCEIAKECTASITIDSLSEPYYLNGINPQKIADYHSTVINPLEQILCAETDKRWNFVVYPSPKEAKFVGMTFNEYKNFVFGATNIDWKKKRDEMLRVKEIFDDASEICISSPPYTKLTFSLSGRGGEVNSGEYNLPDGEVSYGPVEESVNGTVYFRNPTLRDGQIVEGIKLEFHNGVVAKYSALKNQSFLEAMLNLRGGKMVGEFGIGCNYNLNRHTGLIIYDEKMGGTFHIALGKSYPQPLDNGGGLNDADFHWDIVCDLRGQSGHLGGKIYVDGKLVQSEGLWKVPIFK
ncbi:MAG: aminopeptidase [Candidatus Woesearchaeota archaeon]